MTSLWPEPRTQHVFFSTRNSYKEPPKGRIQPPRYMSVLYTWNHGLYVCLYVDMFEYILLAMTTWKTMASPFSEKSVWVFSPFFYRQTHRPTANSARSPWPKPTRKGGAIKFHVEGRGETACCVFLGGSWYFLWCQKIRAVFWKIDFVNFLLGVILFLRQRSRDLVKTVGLSCI